VKYPVKSRVFFYFIFDGTFLIYKYLNNGVIDMRENKNVIFKTVIFMLVAFFIFTGVSYSVFGERDGLFVKADAVPVSSAFKVYRSVKFGFEFRYPTDFTLQETDYGVRVYFPKTAEWSEYIFKDDVKSAWVDVGAYGLDVVQNGNLCNSGFCKSEAIISGKLFKYCNFTDNAMGGYYIDYLIYATEQLGKCYHIALVVKGHGVGAGAHNGKGPQAGDYAPKEAKEHFVDTFKAILSTFYFLPEKGKISIVFKIGSPYMVVNGTKGEIDPGRGTVPVIISEWNRTVLPIRAIVEALGGTVKWNAKERMVTISLNNNNIVLWIGKSEAYVNGVMKWIDSTNHKVKPIIVNDRTMVPIRFVAESLGCKVLWNGKTKTVTIILHREESVLKENCIYSAMNGISTDIQRIENWLKNPDNLSEDKIADLKSKLSELKNELDKYKSLPASEYALPEKIEIVGWINKKGDTLLYSEGMSRSGPFYYIAGIYSGTLETLKPGVKYRMTIYLVHRRIYPFPDYYVYIANAEEVKGGG
jgi:hypothetical protein